MARDGAERTTPAAIMEQAQTKPETGDSNLLPQIELPVSLSLRGSIRLRLIESFQRGPEVERRHRHARRRAYIISGK